MSWRLFSVLLRCMGPNSALVSHITQDREFGMAGRTREPVNRIEGPKAAQSAFVSLFGHYKSKEPGR